MDQIDYAQLYRTYRPALLAYARHYCGDPEAALDIVQQVFLKLLERSNGKAIRNWRGYLLIMTRNEIISRMRTRELHKKLLKAYYRLPGIVEDRLLEKEYRTRLIKAIDRLPAQQKLVFELHCVYNWKKEKVAVAMDVSPHTVNSHLKIIRKKLQQMVA